MKIYCYRRMWCFSLIPTIMILGHSRATRFSILATWLGFFVQVDV